MRRSWIASVMLAWVASTGCAAKSGPYDNNMYRLAAGLTAKEACSCLWVSGLPEQDCRDLVRLTPHVTRFRIDEEAREVKATALLSKAAARYTGEFHGCQLIPR